MGHGLVDTAGELVRLGQALVGEQLGEAARVPWPTARTFQAPCLRYSSRAMTADSASRSVMV